MNLPIESKPIDMDHVLVEICLDSYIGIQLLSRIEWTTIRSCLQQHSQVKFPQSTQWYRCDHVLNSLRSMDQISHVEAFKLLFPTGSFGNVKVTDIFLNATYQSVKLPSASPPSSKSPYQPRDSHRIQSVAGHSDIYYIPTHNLMIQIQQGALKLLGNYSNGRIIPATEKQKEVAQDMGIII
jgi:hypothetical protein